MKYVVTGASTYGVKNMGDDAMFANLVQSIHRLDEQAEITFLARHPDSAYDNTFNIKSIKNLDHDSNIAAAGRIFLGFNRGDEGHNLQAIKYNIDNADILIIGGNSFMEVSDNQFLRGVSSYATTLAILAKFCGTPYALFGLNVVDSIRNDLTIQHAKFLCENAIAITAREQEVVRYLNAIGVNTENITVSGDPAFGMEPIYKNDQHQEILDRCKINLNPNKKTLTIGYRLEYWKDDADQFDELQGRMAGLIDKIKKHYQFQVLFIPNCYYDNGHPMEDDRLVHRQIASRLESKEDVYLVEDELNVYETYALYAVSDLHISNRRHSNAFAAMNGKPFLSLNVSLATHISALLNSLKSPELCIDISSDDSQILGQVKQVLENKDIISKRLRYRTRELKNISQRQVSTILQALKGRT